MEPSSACSSVIKINQIAEWIEWLTGTEVFDPSVYYFHEIPTILNPFTIAWIVFGAMVIALLASVHAGDASRSNASSGGVAI